MKHVVILGGGFAGIAAALELKKQKTQLKYHIKLIDQNPYTLFTPSLYEVATSEEPQKNIVIPLHEILGNGIELITGKVKYIHPNLRRVYLQNNTHVTYDYLILALGSEPAYFNIPGLQKHSCSLKKLSDAIAIKNRIKQIYHEKIEKNEILKIVIGGGGFSGTELAAELVGYKERLVKHHHKSEATIDIKIIQGSDCLLKELDEAVSRIAERRIEDGGAKVLYGNHITMVNNDFITTDGHQKIPFDIFIWTGGVKANSITHQSGFSIDKRGAVLVNQFLQTQSYENVFAIGDIASYTNPLNNKPVPNVVPAADAMGKIAAENIYRKIKGLPMLTFHYIHPGYVVPLRGKYSVAQIGKIHIVGFFGWVIQQFVVLYHLLNILPLNKAFKRWNKFEMELEC